MTSKLIFICIQVDAPDENPVEQISPRAGAEEEDDEKDEDYGGRSELIRYLAAEKEKNSKLEQQAVDSLHKNNRGLLQENQALQQQLLKRLPILNSSRSANATPARATSFVQRRRDQAIHTNILF